MEKDALRRSIIELLERELAAVGFELLDVRLFAGGGRLSVRLFVDRPGGGIDLEGCASASRAVDALLEESALVGEAYVIEVSSPGVRRPLRTPAHFTAVLGQRVELRTGRPRPTSRRGVLLAVDSEGLRLRAVAPEPEPAAGGDAAAEGATAPSAAAGLAAVQAGAGEEFTVAWGDLAAANLDPDFDMQALINADRRRHRDAQRAQRQQAREARQARMARRRRPRPE